MLGLMFAIVRNMNVVVLFELLSYEAPAFAEICKSEPSNIFEDIPTTSSRHFSGLHLSKVTQKIRFSWRWGFTSWSSVLKCRVSWWVPLFHRPRCIEPVGARTQIPFIHTAVSQQSAASVFTPQSRTAVSQQSAASFFTPQSRTAVTHNLLPLSLPHSLVPLFHNNLLPLSLTHRLVPKFSFGVICSQFQSLRFLMAQLPVSPSSSVAVTA
jgi:hypothetical protein